MNNIELNGIVTTKPELTHQSHKENFYEFVIDVTRLSGIIDHIPAVISERIMPAGLDIGSELSLVGQIRTMNVISDGKSRLVVRVFVKNVCEAKVNQVSLAGIICKKPNYRTTPNGREICDFSLAVTRNTGRSDYIPCICWGRNAKFVGNLPVHSKIELDGRFQSREYSKKLSEIESKIMVTYEVSANSIAVLEEVNDGNETL